jgi:hypothetical protein
VARSLLDLATVSVALLDVDDQLPRLGEKIDAAVASNKKVDSGFAGRSCSLVGLFPRLAECKQEWQEENGKECGGLFHDSRRRHAVRSLASQLRRVWKLRPSPAWSNRPRRCQFTAQGEGRGPLSGDCRGNSSAEGEIVAVG